VTGVTCVTDVVARLARHRFHGPAPGRPGLRRAERL